MSAIRRAGFAAVLAACAIASWGVRAQATDEALFGEALTPERGEALRLAAALDPEGWPALRTLARDVVDGGRASAAAVVSIAMIDEAIASLVIRLTPELRRAPLDALESLARAELRMLRAAERGAPRSCASYLWFTWPDMDSLRRVARAAGRDAQLARLRAIAAARAIKARNVAYYVEWISEEQTYLRDAGLTPKEIATVFSDRRPPGIDPHALCHTAIRYVEAMLEYPATLRAAALAFRLTGDLGYGQDAED